MELEFRPPSNGTLALYHGDEKIAEFTDGNATVGEAKWSLDTRSTELKRTDTPDWVASTKDGATLAKADRLDVHVGNTDFVLDNEVKSDWVILDPAGEYVGQFTGARHGVRQPVVSFEKDLPTEQAVFLSWVARELLMASMVRKTGITTGALIGLSILGIIIVLL